MPILKVFIVVFILKSTSKNDSTDMAVPDLLSSTKYQNELPSNL